MLSRFDTLPKRDRRTDGQNCYINIALRLNRPGCLVLRWGGLPVQRRSVTHPGTNRA